MSDKPKKDMDIARKIWLAGIGAYGRAFDDAQEAYSKVGKETAKIFDELVGKGEALEDKVTATAKSYVPAAAERHRASVEDRMDRMRAALGFGETASDQQDRIEALEERLDGIETKLDEILKAVAALTPKPAGRTTAGKPSKKPARKPAAKPASKTSS